jgi:hypothetical protein
MEIKKPLGGPEVGRPGEEYKWESGVGETKPEIERKQGKVCEEVLQIPLPQGKEIINLLKDIKSELKSQKIFPEKSLRNISKIHEEKIEDEIIKELSVEMDKDPDKYYAISIKERKIVESDNSEWNLLEKIEKKNMQKDVIVYCPNEILF